MTWQRKARLGVALFGASVAIGVYAVSRERAAPETAETPTRFDASAVIESSGARLQQETGVERQFDVVSKRQLYYEDGSSKLIDVSITVKGRAGRDFVLRGNEASATGNEQELQLVGEVVLSASDGLVVTAERATFHRQEALIRAPGPITFSRRGMQGRGEGMSYDEANDVLNVLAQTHVTITAEGQEPTEFSADSATLRRPERQLALEGQVHVLRGAQVIEGDRGLAHLTERDAVTLFELRGNGRVSGGSGSLDSMVARDIDLDYADDGRTLERVVLVGDASLSMTARGSDTGRRLAGEKLDLGLASDGAVTRIEAGEGVTFELPASGSLPSRSVTARRLDGVGESGRGLTAARFTEKVEFREAAGGGAGGRTARSQALAATFAEDELEDAVFTGDVTFREDGLTAGGREGRYRPGQGTLRLTGPDANGPPRVSDENIDVVADAIDLTLEGRRMRATGGVKTTLRPQRRTGPDRTSPARPGILRAEQLAYVNAATLVYEGSRGTAVYEGSAWLWQGDTTIRADRLTLNQASGDLVATGTARSSLALDGGPLTGRAAEIRYEDAARTIIYTGTPPSQTARQGGRGSVSPPPAAGGRAAAPEPAPQPGRRTGRGTTSVPGQANLIGPQGDLTADRILVALGREGDQANRADRVEGTGGVTARLDTRVASGDRLTYFAAEERYVMASGGTAPVTVVDPCRTTTGRALVFFKSTDRIIVDGNEQGRTQTRSTGDCTTPAQGPTP